MGHKYRIGEDVYYRPSIKYTAAPGIYTIIKTLPVESEAPSRLPHHTTFTAST